MALSDDNLKLNIDINGDKARQELGNLEQSTKGLKEANKGLRVELQKLEAAGKKNTAEYKQLQTQIKANNAAVKTNDTRMGQLRKEIGLNGLTTKQLRTEYRKLKQAMDNATPGTAAWKSYNTQLKAVKGRMATLSTGSINAGKSMGIFRELLPIASVGALIAVLKSAVSGMFNLAKTMEADAIRSSQVFGDELGYVTAEAEKLATKMGLTTNEFVAAATATGDLLIPLNFTREQAADMSVELQSLAGSLDEWTGGTYGAAGVSNILTKAMLGENEQLKTLGIAIRQDSKEFKDLVKIKKEGTGVTEAQARAMATLELIQIKSADAQAAYNSEGNKLLRTQKSITAWWRNMKESVVEYFQASEGDKLEEQRQKVNLLTRQLYDSNLAEEQRKTLLTELNTLAPKVAASFDTEMRATDLTREALRKYNDEMITKIALSERDEELSDSIEKAGKKKMDVIDKEELAIRLMVKRYDELKESYDAGYLGKNRLDDFKSLEEIVDSSLSTAEKMEKLSKLNIFDQFDKTTFGNYAEWIQNAKAEMNEASNEVDLLEQKRQELYDKYGIKREDNGGNADDPTKPEALSPFDTSQMTSDLEKSMAEMEKVVDNELEEFTKKWSKYRDQKLSEYMDIKEEYLGPSTDARQIAIDKLQQLYDEQIITYEQYAEAKKAITEQMDLEEQNRELQRRETLAEMNELDAEKENLDYEAKLELEDERFSNEMDLLQQRMDYELELHKGNENELLQIELDYKKKKIDADKKHLQNKEQLVEDEMKIDMGRLKVAHSVFEGLATVAGQETALGKAALIAKQGIAVSEAIMALELGRAKTMSKGFPENIPLIIGFIAQTAGLISTIKSAVSSSSDSTSSGYKEGGFTDQYSTDDKVVDFVHSNEFVANADAVRNPTIKPFLDIIDGAQRNGQIANIDFMSALMGTGRKSGGYTSDNGSSGSATTVPDLVQPVNSELVELVRATKEELAYLRTYGVKGVWDYDYYTKSTEKMNSIKAKVAT